MRPAQALLPIATTLLLTAATAGFAATPPPPAPVAMRLSLNDDARIVTLRDTSLRFHTTFGTLRIPLHEVRRIESPPGDPRLWVETTHGDLWRTERVDGSLIEAAGTASGPIALTAADFRKLESLATQKGTHGVPCMRVTLSEGQTAILAPADWTLEIGDASGRWTLPVGALSSLTRTRTGTNHKTETWVVRFPDGQEATLPEPPRNRRMSGHDLYGNILEIPLRNIQSMDMSPNATAAEPRKKATQSQVRATGAFGAVTGELQLVVLRLHSTLGDLLVPGPLVSSVKRRSATDSEITTLYDEHLIGAITPTDVIIRPASGQSSKTVDLRKSALERIDAPALPLPAGGWLPWTFANGERIAARIDATALRLRTTAAKPVEIPSSNLVSVLNHGRTVTVVDDQDQLHYGSPLENTFELILLTSGQKLTVPWEQLRTAGAPANSMPDGMVLVPGGLFIMGRTHGEGNPDELPPHALTLPDFYVDTEETTQARFADFVAATGYRTDAERAGQPTWREPGFRQRPDEPVVCVSWRDAVTYCNWRSTSAGLKPCYEIAKRGDTITTLLDRDGYRLPTEAEWEYAARGRGADVIFPWGSDTTPNSVRQFANFRSAPDTPADDWLWTNPARAFPANALGLFGMAGNVWEWCEDWYFDRAYESVHRQKANDPCVRTGDVAGLNRRVMRGGSFDSELELLHCARRGHGLPLASANRVGFRCARNAPPP